MKKPDRRETNIARLTHMREMRSNTYNFRHTLKITACVLMAVLLALCPRQDLFAAGDSRALYDQGMEAFSKGNYGSAELLFRKIVDSGEQEYYDRAWFFMARSIFNKKKYEAALFEFKSFLNRCRTDHLAVESRYWMGECYFNISDYPNAIEEFRRFITRTATGDLVPRAHDRIATIYFTQKRYDEAVIEWEAARAKSTDRQMNATSQYRIGEALFMSGRHEEAIKNLTPLLGQQSDPGNDAMTRMMLGRIHQKKGEHVKALQMFNAIPAGLAAQKPFTDSQYFKAVSSEKLKQAAQAQALLESFTATAKDSRWYYNGLYRLGVLLLRGQDRERGIGLLEQVRAGSAKAYLKTNASIVLGDYYAAGSPEKAIPFLDEAILKAGPGKKNRLMVLLGKTCLRVKKYDRAVEVLNLYLKENPFDANRDEINFLRARAYLEMGEISKADEIFESIKKDNPFSRFNSESNYYLALVHEKKGNTARAISLLKEYVGRKNVEQSYDAYLLLMQIYLAGSDLESAGRAADILAKNYLNRKDVEIALYQYTAACMKKGRDARRFVNIIMNRFGTTESAAELSYDLGNDNLGKNNFAYAIIYYDRYLKSLYTKNSGGAYYKKIVSLYRLKRYEEIITIITRGQFPSMNEVQWKEIPLLHARSYYHLNKYDKVYMTLDKRNVREYPREDVLMYVRCALSVGDYRSAIEASEFLESDRNYLAESLYLIGDHLLRKEKKEEADLYFLKIINDCPGTRFVSHAKLSLGEIALNAGRLRDAADAISAVDPAGDGDVQNRKDSLLILCYFEMGSTDAAVSHAEAHLGGLLSGTYGEQVMQRMLWYYYKKKDLQQFGRYATFLKRYPGNEPLVACLSGRIQFYTGNYRASYTHFLALSRMKGEYARESWYHLGMYAMLAAGNPAGGLDYFTKVIDAREGRESLTRKALIQSAIIYHEMKNDMKARECLERVMSSSGQGLMYMQARNLYEAFGYGVK